MRKLLLIIAKMVLMAPLFLGVCCTSPSGQNNNDNSTIDAALYNPEDTDCLEKDMITSIKEKSPKMKDTSEERFATDESIVGTWRNVSGFEAYVFNADHTGIFTTRYAASRFKWKKSGNEIKLTHNDGGKTLLKIKNGKIEEWSDIYERTLFFKKVSEQ